MSKEASAPLAAVFGGVLAVYFVQEVGALNAVMLFSILLVVVLIALMVIAAAVRKPGSDL